MAKSSRAVAVRSFGVLALLSTVLLTTGPAAQAASRTVGDGEGDVYSLTAEQPTKVGGPDGDIVSVTTVHRPKSVQVRIRARHLSLDQALMFVKVRTAPAGPAYFFNGTADIGMRMAIMTRGQARVIVCPGLWMRFQPAKRTVTAVIPRHCLGDPRWVRTGAALATTDSMVGSLADEDFDPFAEGAATGTIDIAGVAAVGPAQMSSAVPPLPFGPRVRVG